MFCHQKILSWNEWKQNQFWKVETISLCWVTNLCVISVTVTVDTISSSKSELPIASYIIYYIMIYVLPSGVKWVHRILLRWMLGYGNIKVNSQDWCLFKVRVQHLTEIMWQNITRCARFIKLMCRKSLL